MQARTKPVIIPITKGSIMFSMPNQGSRFGLRHTAAATAAALALAFAGSALAQPGGGPGGFGPGGFGGHPGAHAAMAGPGGGDEMVGHIIARAKDKLNLNTSQQLKFDANVAQSKAARDSGRALHQQVKDALTAELAKPEPDLAAVAAVADGAQQQGLALRHQVRDAWLALYATFSPEQKAVVRQILQNHVARMDSFRQKMKEHLQGAG
jgi:Spy/CpxP family protein refolding chaperone